MGNRKQGGPRRVRKREVVGHFGPAVVTVDLDSGRPSVTGDAEVIDPEDRDEATRWVLQQLRAVGQHPDPLQVRDALWK